MSFVDTAAPAATEAPSAPEGNVTDVTPEVAVETPVEAAPQEPVGETYAVKIDGQEQQVTLDELRNGYQRQSDYTRKTQELAEQRNSLQRVQALASALDTDYVGTVKALAQHAGLTYAEAEASVQGAEWDEADPQEQRLATIESQLADQRSQQLQSGIEKEFAQLESSFGEIDRAEVIQAAITNRTTVTNAYRLLHFDKLQEQVAKQQDDATRTDAKRAAQTVSGGAGVQRGATTAVAAQMPKNAREAIVAAIRQVKGS